MKKTFFGLIMSILLIAPLGQVAKAYSPSLSAAWEGNNVRITVSAAQPNARVDVYYRAQSSQVWSVTSGLGNTDWNGYFSNAVDLGLQQGASASVYALVGSDQTTTVNLGYGSGCWGYNCNYGNLTFSQNNVNLSAGQSQSVSIYSGGNYYGNYYVSNNSNSSVVTANISGNTLNLYGQTSGSANITVCQSGSYYNYNSSNNCGTVYVTVGGGMVGSITFSPSNPTLYVGQSLNVTINTPYLYSGNYYVSNNSNSSVVTASVSGNNLALYGQSAGNSTLTVCLSGGSYACSNLYVSVSGGNYYGNLTFSQNNVNLSAGQSQSVSIYSGGNYYGNYYVSNNSNSSVVTANISGNTLNLYGQTSGSANITVCQSGSYYNYNSSNNCGTVYVTVGGYGYNTFYLSPSSVTVNVGQTATVIANFSYTYSGYLYLGSNSNPGVATASFSGSTVSVYGQSAGSTTMNICYSGQCQNLYVSVSGGSCYYGSGCYGNSLYFTSTSLPQPTVNQYYSVQLQVTGGSGSYTYTLDSGSLPAGLTLGSSGLIFGTPVSTNAASFAVRASDSYGRSAVASLTLTPQSGSVLGTSLFNNGALIQENGTVYIVYKNTKTGFASAYAFQGLGFKFSQVVRVAASGLADSGYVVSTPTASHPWGSWIKSGRTVYFVHENGLIPVPSGDIFQSNGGDWGLVVAANSYDFNRPVLPNLDYNDNRLR